MDFRRIIAFGKSSHVVSLPRDWMNENNLKKGDLVHLEQEVGKLTISAKEKSEEREIKKTVINLGNKSLDRIKREIYSGYLNYSDYIVIRGKSLPKYNNEIFNTISNLMALEIIEQTNEEIVAQDFLRIADVNLKEKIRKCDITIRSILKDLKDPTFKDYENIIVRQQLVYRIYFVVLKIIKAVFSEPTLIKKTNLNYLELLNIYTKIFAFHNISRNLRLIALKGKVLDKERGPELNNILNHLDENYLKIMKLIHTQNIDRAFELSRVRDDSFKEIEDSKIDIHFKEKIINIYFELHEILKREYS